jgi:hypothetical protein
LWSELGVSGLVEWEHIPVEREAIPVLVRFVLKVAAAVFILVLGATVETQEAVGLVVAAATATARPGMGRQDKGTTAGPPVAVRTAVAAVAEREERVSQEIITNSGEALV